MNYYNYFTEIEEHFQRKRGAQIYLSPVDWALIASWREAGIPLAAVLAGIDAAFEKFEDGRRRDAARPRALAYCAAAVLDAAEAMRAGAVGAGDEAAAAKAADEAFRPDRIAGFLERAAAQVAEARGLDPAVAREVGETLERLRAGLAAGAPVALPELDRTLTVLDDKVHAGLLGALPVEDMVKLKAELEGELAPYRRKLRPEQLALIERQFLQRRLLERAGLPRLSLFFMA